jgi:hypothetical protein
VTFPAYEGALVGGVRSLNLSEDELAELARMVAEFHILPTTPVQEPVEFAAEPPVEGTRSGTAHAKFKFAAELRERGLL